MRRVVIDDLQDGMISNQTIYNERGTVLVGQGVSLTSSIIKRLKKTDIAFIDIQDEEQEVTKEISLTLTVEKSISAVKNLSESLFALKTINIKNNINEIEKVIYSVLDRPFIQEFLGTCCHDGLLYNHSLRTAIMSTNMGLIKGYDTLNLQKLAMSAIVHDCGMGKEFKEDEEHAYLGFIKLRKDLDVDMVIALVCLQHHEHDNGFPFSCGRSQISEFASLIAIVDYYDRLLMKNIDPRQALFDTIGQKKIRFNPNMTDLFSSTIDWSRIYNIS